MRSWRRDHFEFVDEGEGLTIPARVVRDADGEIAHVELGKPYDTEERTYVTGTVRGMMFRCAVFGFLLAAVLDIFF